MELPVFDRLVWQGDRMLLDELVFRLEHYQSADWNGGDHFRFFKIKELIDQYASFFSRRGDFRPEGVLELGIFDGGSTAFWYELFRPQKHIALDIQDRVDSSYFRHYVESRGLGERIKTFWKTNQADKIRLRSIVETEFEGPLDLVIDDASHFYRQTRASFEALFPLLMPGGLYIIEDWAWGHWPEFFPPDHPWAGQEPLTPLVVELVEAAGTSTELIHSVVVFQGFVVVERGPQQLDKATNLNLDDHIKRRPRRQQPRPGFMELAKKVLRKSARLANRFGNARNTYTR